MTDAEPDGHPRAVVWLRDPLPPPGDSRQSALSRLRELESEGTLSDVSVRVWGRFVEASPPDDGGDRPIRDRIAEFYEWADRNDRSLDPAFRRYERSTLLSREGTDVIRLPLICVAIYRGDRLIRVFPCSTEEGTDTVPDCLSRLEANGIDGEPGSGYSGL